MTCSSPPTLTVLIPAYNESARLGPTLAQLMTRLPALCPEWEILVVDDGSQDGTATLVNGLAAQDARIRCHTLSSNAGKGRAVACGVAQARGTWVLLYDADGATPIDALPRLWALLAKQPDAIVIGSRALAGTETQVIARWHRRLMGRVFAALVGGLVPGVRDTQCGFKLLSRRLARRLAQHQRVDGFAFDVEWLHMAHVNGVAIREVPIDWHHVPGSKINLWTAPLRMLWDCGCIGLNSLRGGYRWPSRRPVPAGRLVLRRRVWTARPEAARTPPPPARVD